MTDDELIEEMAMEMFPTAWADHDDPHDDGQISKKYARLKARVGLLAIRKALQEPTDAMIDAGDAALFNAGDGDLSCLHYLPASYIGPVWKAMLSASPLKGET
jgi:hypothetical protein